MQSKGKAFNRTNTKVIQMLETTDKALKVVTNDRFKNLNENMEK